MAVAPNLFEREYELLPSERDSQTKPDFFWIPIGLEMQVWIPIGLEGRHRLVNIGLSLSLDIDSYSLCKIDPCLGKLLPGEKYGVSWKRRIVKKLAEKFNELDKIIYLHKLSAKRISH